MTTPDAATASTASSASAARRVLFVSNDPPGAAVYRYRCENLAQVLRHAGWTVDVAWIGDARVRVDHDVVVLHRICAVAEGRAYARAARACGATLVYGADDLVFEADAFPDPADARKRRYAPLHAAMARDADAVLVSTEYLAERARALPGANKPVRVVRNFLSPELIDLSTQARSGRATDKSHVTLGYLSGTPTHDADFASIAAPLAAALRAYPATRLLLVGPVTPPSLILEAAGGRLDRFSLVPWRELPSLLAKVDVNLAPLDLTRPFNHAKSEIKFLEAAAVGVPTLASASAGFREALAAEPGTAPLAETPEDWERLLHEFIADPPIRVGAAACARAFVLLHGSASAHRAAILATFEEFTALSRPRPAHPVATIVGRNPFAPKNLARRALGLLRNAK